MTMRDTKIKLIFPPNPYARYIVDEFFLPHGLSILTFFLKDHNYNVVLEDLGVKIDEHNKRFRFSPRKRINAVLPSNKVDTNKIMDYLFARHHDNKIDHFAEQIAELASCKGYDLIGISVLSDLSFLFALLLAKKVKSMSKIKIVLGGPFITLFGKDYFAQSPFIDYMVIGDGQVPLLKLIEHLEGRAKIEDIPSLIYRDNANTKTNPRKRFPIEELYMPDFSDLPLQRYRSKTGNAKIILPYQLSRGCTHNCSFCSQKAVNPHLEFKSHQKVLRELKAMQDRYQSNAFLFCDEAINCSYEYLDEFCDMLIKEKLNVEWVAYARPDNLDRKILHKMSEAGCSILWFGIESASNRILRSMRKGFTIEKAQEVLKDSHQEGIKNLTFFITGYPYETEEDIAQTAEFIKINSKYISYIIESPFRITSRMPLYNYPQEFGIENLRPDSKLMFSDFAFDEINGLKWEEKRKQRQYAYSKIKEADFKYIISKRLRVKSLPFWVYFLLKGKPCLTHWSWPFRFRYLLTYLLKKVEFYRSR